MLTYTIIKRIVDDIAPTGEGLRKVGIVGSFARTDFTAVSDVDLVFVMDKENTDAIMQTVGARIRAILLNQFRVSLDVINYDTIQQRIRPSNTIGERQRQGYRQMLNDLVWIWERG